MQQLSRVSIRSSNFIIIKKKLLSPILFFFVISIPNTIMLFKYVYPYQANLSKFEIDK